MVGVVMVAALLISLQLITSPYKNMSKRPPTYSSSSKQPSTKKAKQSTLSGFFGSKTSDDTTSSSSALSEYKIFCDLDGVLVDFDAGVKKLFNGRSPGESAMCSFFCECSWTTSCMQQLFSPLSWYTI